MKNLKASTSVIITTLLLILPTLLFAENNLDQFPKSGLLAAQGSVALGSGIALQQLPIGNQAPILGSLSRSGNGNWDFSVQNNSKESLKITTELVEVDGSAKFISSRGFSYRLKPGERKGNSVQANPSATGAGIRLKNWVREN